MERTAESGETEYLVGTCTDMCPRKEMLVRERERLLHVYEMKSGTESDTCPKADPRKIVKAFSRSAAGRKTDPSDLRPFPVLMKTIQYLYYEIFPRHEHSPLTVYNFMFDRLHSVRQDTVTQNLTSTEQISIFEPITRFHIYFGYVLIGESETNFDPFINNTHIQECLKRLLVCYDESDYDIVKNFNELTVNNSNSNCLKNRQDIEAAYMLFNLPHIEAMARGARLANIYIKEEIIKLCFARYLKNFVKVFQLMKQLPPLLLCVAAGHIPQIRKESLQAFSHAFSSANCAYPVSHLSHLLLYEDETDLIEDCKHFNIKITDNNVNFLKKEFNSTAGLRKLKRLSWIDNVLLQCDLPNLLWNGFE